MVHDASSVFEAELFVERRTIGEAKAGQRGDNDVVRKRYGGVLLFEEVEDGEELKEGAC